MMWEQIVLKVKKNCSYLQKEFIDNNLVVLVYKIFSLECCNSANVKALSRLALHLINLRMGWRLKVICDVSFMTYSLVEKNKEILGYNFHTILIVEHWGVILAIIFK